MTARDDVADFAAVDRGDGYELVAMMDATDAWAAVRDARAWVIEQTGPGGGAVVLDAGSGPGTFGRTATTAGALSVDVDVSRTMLDEARRRDRSARPVLADVARLPLRAGAAQLVHAERILQWTTDPTAALAELWRVTARGGWLAVTDTDWGTLAVGVAPDRMAAAALGWVPHPRFARTLPSALAALGARDVRSRIDTVVLTEWDPDAPEQRDGPPGLPLHSIAAGGTTSDRAPLDADLVAIAARARTGRFSATLDLVSVVARRDA